MALCFQNIYLRNFRNFEEESLIFSPQINVFHGLNAQGKTNLLEALGIISTGRSFRTQHLSNLIKEDSSFFFIEANILKDDVPQTIRLTYDGQNKKVECNSTQHSSFQALLGLIPSIFYTSPDIDLINGPPIARRRFLNLHLSQSDPLYFHHLLRYWRAMRQRNALLRSGLLNGIDCWEKEMALSANYLFCQRASLLNNLNGHLQKFCPLLATETTFMRYMPSHSEDFLEQLHKNRAKEQQMGLTIAGPHRDDFSISINQKSARLFASDGQKRTSIAALRLSEWELLKIRIDAPPVFGIDDIEQHLDPNRKDLFCKALAHLGQVFITTPHEKMEWSNASLYCIFQGKVQENYPDGFIICK